MSFKRELPTRVCLQHMRQAGVEIVQFILESANCPQEKRTFVEIEQKNVEKSGKRVSEKARVLK